MLSKNKSFLRQMIELLTNVLETLEFSIKLGLRLIL